jgi:hypothetical protein
MTFKNDYRAGVLRFFKFTWKSFKSDFGQLEGHLSMAKDEVDEEIKLASEQEAYKNRTQQQIQFDQIRKIGTRQEIEISQSTTFRARQVDEIEENKRHRSEQRMALAQTQAMTIQKIVKTDGIKDSSMVIRMILNDVLIFHRASQNQITCKGVRV